MPWCALPGRADAEAAIAMLGARARGEVQTDTLLHFGQWLDWPDWLREGTALTGHGPLPPIVSLADGLIMVGNIIDHADHLSLVERMLTAPRPAVGNFAALQMLHAPDLGVALASLAEALAATNPWLACQLTQEQDTVDIAFLPALRPGPIFRFAAIGASAQFCRAIEALRCNNLADMLLETRLHGAREAERLLAGFRCRIAPSQGVERLRFPRAWQDTPNPHYDPLLWSVARARPAVKVIETGKTANIAAVRAFIVDMLESEQRAPRLKQAAAHFGISARTIVRTLARHDTSFHRLVEQERKARALHLITDPSMSLAEVANALGFSDMSSFGRSCRGWFGHTPGALRTAGGGQRAQVSAPPSLPPG